MFRWHNLIDPENLPNWVTTGNYTHAQLMQIVHDWVYTTVSTYRTEVGLWDVISEALRDDNGQIITSVLGGPTDTEWIEVALRAAMEANPTGKLMIDDYYANANLTVASAKHQGMRNLVSGLKAKGIRVDVVGIEMFHTPIGFNAATLRSALTDFSNLGVEVAITQATVPLMVATPDAAFDASLLAQQATAYKNLVDSCLQVPACKTFNEWGFTDRYQAATALFAEQAGGAGEQGWRPHIYGEAYQTKPAYDALRTRLLAP
jgi:endo-1,4-beta-xylanase